MAFTLPELPYSMDALKPNISAETLEFHHGKHHQAYVTNLNGLITGTKFEKSSLEEIVKGADPGPLLNNSGQHFNHSFYWKSLSPKGGGDPKGPVADAIKKGFGDFAAFKKKFSDAATTHFGSGWAWLVKAKDGSFQVIGTHDAGCPIRDGQTRSLPATYGSMRTTSTIATHAQSTSKHGGTSSTGNSRTRI